jgi:hypothetical protein
MNQKKNKIGVFYTCYKEKDAVEYSLDVLYSIYPDIPVYLISDGGADYKFLKDKEYGKYVEAMLEEDSRGMVPKITEDTYLEPANNSYIKKSIETFLERVKRAIDFCDCEYLLVMEPDVLVRGKLNIPDGSKFMGSRINSGLSQELKNVMSSVEGAIPVDVWGATPAIFSCETYLLAYDALMGNPDLLDRLCKSDCRLANYDVLFGVLFGVIGVDEEFNPDIIECYRDINWKNSNKPLVHQFRAKYPTSSDGYDGRHLVHEGEDQTDKWIWK